MPLPNTYSFSIKVILPYVIVTLWIVNVIKSKHLISAKILADSII